MNKIYLDKKDKENFDLLYNTSAITIEGLLEDSISDYVNWIKQHSKMNCDNVYIISGKVMNDYYNLSGKNAYNDDVTIVSVPLETNLDAINLSIKKFEIGARWFDDIVDNNLDREVNK